MMVIFDRASDDALTVRDSALLSGHRRVKEEHYV